MGYNWNRFSAPTEAKVMMFKRELFEDVFNQAWREYEKTRDDAGFSLIFINLLEDFPELTDLFDRYLMVSGGGSDKDTIMRFLRKLTIIYENLEVQTKVA